MSTLLEKLVGAKALIESALEEITEQTAPAPVKEQAKGECKHEHREEITGAGRAGQRIACVDCGETLEANDAN